MFVENEKKPDILTIRNITFNKIQEFSRNKLHRYIINPYIFISKGGGGHFMTSKKTALAGLRL